MANELQPGDVRLGWLIDGNPDTPERAVGLRNTGDGIKLEIPLDGQLGFSDPYGYWFEGNVLHADDPGKIKRQYQPPGELLFHDVDGPIALIGCSVDTWKRGTEGGRGVVDVGGAVIGARTHGYARVNGMRSVLPALGLWTGITSSSRSEEFDSNRRYRSARIELESPEPVPLARRLNLTLRPSWRTFHGDVPGHLVSVDEIHVETLVRRATGIDEHIRQHLAIRELLVVAAGARLGFTDVLLQRTDDPNRTLDGVARGDRWAPFITYRLPQHSPWRRRPTFIFDFGDIGAAGVRRWIRLRDRFRRGLRPLVSVLEQPGLSAENRTFSLGVALEAVGYTSEAAHGGTRLNRRKQLSFSHAVERILDDIGWCPIRDPEDWKADMTASYNGIKHADRPLPDDVTLFWSARKAEVVLRTWVAVQLGADEERVMRGLASEGAGRLIREPA